MQQGALAGLRGTDRQTGRGVPPALVWPVGAGSSLCLPTALFCLLSDSLTAWNSWGLRGVQMAVVPVAGPFWPHPTGFQKAALGMIPKRPVRQDIGCLWLCHGF